MKYDAFISYSHSYDKELAIAIQRALQKIAKPWYKLRNLNVFRDEDSLSASPHLWDNIEKSLSKSNYFIYIASNDSSQSEWVEKEISWWIKNKQIQTILIVQGDNLSEHNEELPLPEILRKCFDTDPFYIDLRLTKVDGKYSLKNPNFKQEVLKLAAHLHGKMPKDLLSDDVKAYKIAIYSRNFGILLITLFFILLGFYIFNRYKLKNKETEAYSNFLISEAAKSGKNKALAIYYYNYLNNPTDINFTLLDLFYQNNSFYIKKVKKDTLEPNTSARASSTDKIINARLSDGSFKKINIGGEFSCSLFDKFSNKEYYFGGSDYDVSISNSILLETDFEKKETVLLAAKIPFFSFRPELYINNDYIYIYSKGMSLEIDEFFKFYRFDKKTQKITFFKSDDDSNIYPRRFYPDKSNKYLYVEAYHGGNNGIDSRSIYKIESKKLISMNVDHELNGLVLSSNQIFGEWFPFLELKKRYYNSLGYDTENSIDFLDNKYFGADDNMMILVANGSSIDLRSLEGNPVFRFLTQNFIETIEDVHFHDSGFDVLSNGRIYRWNYDDGLNQNFFSSIRSFARHRYMHSESENNVLDIEDIQAIKSVGGKFNFFTDKIIQVRYGEINYSFLLDKPKISKNVDSLKLFFNKMNLDILSKEDKAFLNIEN